MGKFRPKKFVLSISVISIIVVGIYASADLDSSFGFTLNLPTNAFVSFINSDGETETIHVLDFDIDAIACWVQTELKVVDKQGIVIATTLSEKFVKVNPSIPLTLFDANDIFTAGQELSGFKVTPIIMCAVDQITDLTPEHTFSEYFDALGIPQQAQFQANLVILPSEIVVRMYSSDASCGTGIDIFDETCKNVTGSNALLFHDTFNGILKINEQIISDNTKHDLGTLTIDGSSIERFLENGRYSSRMLITFDGLINIAYQKIPEFSYIIPLNTEREFVDFNHPFHKTNNWKEIFSPLLLDRTLDVGHNVNVCNIIDIIAGTCDCPPDQHLETVSGVSSCIDNNVPPTCAVDEFWNGSFCEAVGTQPNICTPPLVKQGNICVNPNTGGTGGTGIIIIDELFACINSGNPDCLTNQKFIPIWLGLVGLIVIIIAIVQGASRSRPVDIYGVPSSF